MLQSFDDRLRKLRKEKGLSQQQLADKLKIQRSSVGTWETGMSDPTVEHVIELAIALNCTTDYLLGLSSKDLVDISALDESGKSVVRIMIDQLTDKNK